MWIEVDGDPVHLNMKKDRHGREVELTPDELEAIKELVRAARNHDDVEIEKEEMLKKMKEKAG